MTKQETEKALQEAARAADERTKAQRAYYDNKLELFAKFAPLGIEESTRRIKAAAAESGHTVYIDWRDYCEAVHSGQRAAMPARIDSDLVYFWLSAARYGETAIAQENAK